MDDATPRIWQLGQVSQIGFVVPDVEKTALEWVRLTGADPFFMGEFKLLFDAHRSWDGHEPLRWNLREALGH